jgi:hypothetical protein
VKREIKPVEKDETGRETHPAFGALQVVRRSSVPGAVLFDSDIRHGHTVVVTLTTASRRRDLHRDWIHPDHIITEVEMSEAQWASFVSSMGTSAVPVTIRMTRVDGGIDATPGLEFDPRLAHSMDEVRGAAERTFGAIERAVAAYDALDPKATAKERRAAMSRIRDATTHARSNLAFASQSLTEHAEDVVQRSRADIEAMALQAADRLGLPRGTDLIQLTSQQLDAAEG